MLHSIPEQAKVYEDNIILLLYYHVFCCIETPAIESRCCYIHH
jgi:hypothetical protein